MRYAGVVRTYLSLSARAALPVGMPIYFGVLVVVCIVFVGPQGMRAADLVFTLRTAPLWALVLWLGWIVLVFPIARLALTPPSSSYLRWLPAPRTVLYASAALAVFVAELPWIILFLRGEGLLSGIAAGLGAVALHASWATRPFRFVHVLVLLLWTIAAYCPISSIAVGVAGLAAVLAVKHAIDRAPEVHALALGSARVQAPAVALASAHVKYVVRKEPAALGRMVVLASLLGLILPFAARGHDIEAPTSYGGLALGLAAIGLSPALSGVSAAVIRSERLSAWLSDVLGTTARTRVFAAALASALFGALAGILLGLVALGGLREQPMAIVWRVVTIPALWGMCIGAALAGLARETEASPQRGDRGMVSLLVVMSVGVVSASSWGERALGFHVLLAAVGIALAPGRWQRLRRRRGMS